MLQKKFMSFSRVILFGLHVTCATAAWSYSSPKVGASEAFAQDGRRALISEPDGLLRGNAKAKDAVGLINWVLMVSCAVPATLFTIHAGKRFNDQEYGAAFGSAIGAVIAGLGGYLAFSFI